MDWDPHRHLCNDGNVNIQFQGEKKVPSRRTTTCAVLLSGSTQELRRPGESFTDRI